MQEADLMKSRRIRAAIAIVLVMALAAVPVIGMSAQAEALQASRIVETQAASGLDKAAAKVVKAVVKKAKATKGSSTAKLKKIYGYIAKDKSNGGTYEFGALSYFYVKFGSPYYSALPSKVKSTLMERYYKKYAYDMAQVKKGSCFHYAALFGMAAKQVLGAKATVKIVAGASMHTGELVPDHAWAEVTLGKKTYIYDTQAGNSYSRSDDASSTTDYGPYCGTLKGKLKANYQNYKGTKSVVVKL